MQDLPFSTSASTSSSFLNPLEDPDDDLPEFLAALEALQPDPDMMPVEREGNARAHYIKPRNTSFWDTFKREADEVRWKKLLRVSTTTFDYLVEQLSPLLQTETPHSFSKIPKRVLEVDRQIAIALHCLATGNSAFSISELLGVSKAIVYLTTRRFCRAVWSELKPQHLSWPTDQEMRVVIAGFEEQRGLSNCCGAIDCMHFLLDLLAREASACWFDRDHNYSMIM